MRDLLTNPFSLALLMSVVLALAVDRWERRRLARPGGPYAAADLSGPILLAAVTVGLWGRLPEHVVLGPVLLAGAGLSLVGALTDRWRPSRGLRFVAAMGAAYGLCGYGLCVAQAKLPFSATLVGLGWAGPLVTALWLGLSGSLFARAATIPRVSLGVGAMAAGTLHLVCLMRPDLTGPAARDLTLALAGACLGMLAFPDYLSHGKATAGGYVLGFLVGAAAVLGVVKHTAFLVALLPLLLIGVPVFAAVYSWVADWVRGRRTGFWGRRHRHVHEILMEQGYSERQVAIVLLAGTAAMCLLALALVALIEVSFIVKVLVFVTWVVTTLALLYVALRLMGPACTPAELPAEVNVLGVRVHRVTMAEAMARVAEFIGENRPHMIVTSDAIGIMQTHENPELRRIVNEADLVTADGAGVILAARLLGLPLGVRVSGCDMVVEISKVAAAMSRSVYLLGAAPGVAEQAAEALRRQAPGLAIAGCRDGYFRPEDEAPIIAEIAAARPAALFVALGIPRQEKWIKAHMAELGVPVCIGIGGSFDVISGIKQRAPEWMQRSGLEWLYRTVKEPSRLPRLWALPRIVFMAFGQLLRPPEAATQTPFTEREP